MARVWVRADIQCCLFVPLCNQLTTTCKARLDRQISRPHQRWRGRSPYSGDGHGADYEALTVVPKTALYIPAR